MGRAQTMSKVGTWYPAMLERLAAACRNSGVPGFDVAAGDIDAIVLACGHLALERPEYAPRHLRVWLDGLRVRSGAEVTRSGPAPR